MKNHQKSLASPRSWEFGRKDKVFITKANPGPHNQDLSVPLCVLIRDMLKMVDKMKDVRYILNNKTVLVNGVRRTDHRFPIGRFDIITFKETKEAYQITLNDKGKLIAKKAKNSIKPLKIKSKTMLKGGRTQLNFMDGTNLIVDKDSYKTGDSVVVEGKKVKEHLPLNKGAIIYLVGGKHIGKTGILEDIMDEKILYKADDGEKIETLKTYAVVVGKDKPVLDVE